MREVVNLLDSLDVFVGYALVEDVLDCLIVLLNLKSRIIIAKGNKSIVLLEEIVFHHQSDAVLNVVLEEEVIDLVIIQIKTNSIIQIIK